MFASETDRANKKVPWIKTGDVILWLDQISRSYSILGSEEILMHRFIGIFRNIRC